MTTPEALCAEQAFWALGTLDLKPVLLGGVLLDSFLGQHLGQVNAQLLGRFLGEGGYWVSYVSRVSGGVSGMDGTLQSLWCLLNGSEVLPRVPMAGEPHLEAVKAVVGLSTRDQLGVRVVRVSFTVLD